MRILKIVVDWLKVQHAIAPRVATPLEEMTDEEIDAELHTLLEHRFIGALPTEPVEEPVPDLNEVHEPPPADLPSADCKHRTIIKNGKRKDGTLRYRCKTCKRSVYNPSVLQLANSGLIEKPPEDTTDPAP